MRKALLLVAVVLLGAAGLGSVATGGVAGAQDVVLELEKTVTTGSCPGEPSIVVPGRVRGFV